MAGAGYKLFNTGDVLTAAQVNTYLMEQTVMVFADAAARTTALSGVVSEGMISYLKDTNAVEVYNGSAWVSSDDPNAIQNTIVDAKGDLISATANDTPARLAVGNDGETLVADSSTSTGLRWQGGQAAGRNVVTNGSYDIWQRGTSGLTGNSVSAGAGYNADRWQNYSANSITISRQATGDTTNLPFIQYCARVQRNSGQTNLGEVYTVQSIETANSLPLAGRAVTLSFYARRGANFSAASNVFTSAIYYGTGTDQNIFSYTGQTVLVTGSHTLTTTWQRFQITATMPATATEIAPVFYYVPTGTAGANDFYEITGVQLELGSVATPFTRAGGTLAGELAACQRYYYRSTPGVSYGAHGLGYATSTTAAAFSINLPVTMRARPSSVEYANLAIDLIGTGNYAFSTLTLSSVVTGFNVAIVEAGGSTGLTQYRPYNLSNNNNTAGYLGLSAEL